MSNQELRSTFRRSLVAIPGGSPGSSVCRKGSRLPVPGIAVADAGHGHLQVAAAIRGGASTLDLVRLARWVAALSRYTLRHGLLAAPAMWSRADLRRRWRSLLLSAC